MENEIAVHCARHKVQYLERELAKAKRELAQAELNCPGVEQKKMSTPKNDRFSEVWALYPKKVGKPAAEKAWRKLSKADKDQCIRHLPSRAWPEDKQFIPNPATFINQRRWEDEVAQVTSEGLEI